MGDGFICINGHFYQPPHENPWFDEVKNWRIINFINNYSRICFNFVPTLHYWIDSHQPSVHHFIVDAYRESLTYSFGPWSAIALCMGGDIG